jgi:hypothetical protein
MKCEFEETYHTVAAEYANAVYALSKAEGKLPEEERQRLRGEVQFACISLSNARLWFELHRSEHSC